MSVTFFTRRDVREGFLRRLEQSVGSKFELIGTPQQPDLIRVAAEAAEEKLEHVHDEMIKAFLPVAEKLIQEKGENVALAAALAVISGYTQPLQKRSLLSSMEGYSTVLLKNSLPIHGVGWVFMIIKKFLGEGAEKQAKDIELCQGKSFSFNPSLLPARVVHSSLQARSANDDIKKNQYHFGLIFIDEHLIPEASSPFHSLPLPFSPQEQYTDRLALCILVPRRSSCRG